MIIAKFCGWEEATIAEYRNCYHRYGGNFSTHPDVLSYLHHHADCAERFYVHQTAGKIDGAICTWAKKYLANDISTGKLINHLGLPIARDELILPVTRKRKLLIPFKSKILSAVNKNIVNRNEMLNARRTICLAKTAESFSKKTVQTRKRELKKFFQLGGEIKDYSEFTPKELIDIFDLLFETRRGKRIECKEEIIQFVEKFKENLFGKLLFYKDKPCAFQLITKSDSCGVISLDFINIGIDTRIKEFSLGTMLMWLNVNEAFVMSKNENKEMRFSFGRPSSAYKSRWCYQEKLGRLL